MSADHVRKLKRGKPAPKLGTGTPKNITAKPPGSSQGVFRGWAWGNTPLGEEDESYLEWAEREEARITEQRILADSKVLTFAYGSNMDQAQMLRRCPSAKRVGPAWLPDHKLAFVGYSHVREGAVATVLSCPAEAGHYVLGMVWEISMLDMLRLDGYEGAPKTYERKFLEVHQWDGAPSLRAEVYVHTPDHKAMPGTEYLRQIAGAYVRAGFKLDPLVDAVLNPARFTLEERSYYRQWLALPHEGTRTSKKLLK